MMPESIRLVSDGEELVLSTEGPTEDTRSRERPAARSKPLAIQYLGFHDVKDRREYQLRARRGTEEGDYTLSIELAAFAERRALLQDGPQICYEKLLQELADSVLRRACALPVTPGDLAAYRERHSVPARSRYSPQRSGDAAKG
jgi:hypothetical protein